MKLVKLYSNSPNFKTVTFSEQLNFVLGKIVDTTTLDKDCHNLGKTTLIELLDFMLLKEISKGSFLKQSKFNNHIFYLQIKLNNGKYLTIKRPVSCNTKISMKLDNNCNDTCVSNGEWDYEDLPLTSKNKDKNPKYILNSLLGFNVLQDESYRNILNYFLRTQNDYSDEFHLSKYAGSDSEWKPLLFELLGFNGELLKSKYELDKQYEVQKQYINKLQKDREVDLFQVDKVKGIIQIKEKEKASILRTLSEFNFYIKEKEINSSLVDQIETQISNLNTERYELEMQIKMLKESIEHGVTFNLDATEQIFNEVEIYFSEQLKKSYRDLIEFNTKITVDRNKHIYSTVQSKTKRVMEINKELEDLNEQKGRLLNILTDKDIFGKYKFYQNELLKVEGELQKNKAKLDELTVIEKENNKLDDINEKIKALVKLIGQEIKTDNIQYNKIRTSFSEYVKEILNQPGLLSISQNTSGNIDFHSEICNEEAITYQGKGHSYKKILCACFDLALATNYAEKSFYKFVFHDGCLETLDPRKQKKYLDLLSKLSAKYDIQYILTLIESDLPTINGQLYKLPDNCTISVELSDLDDTTNLFGFTF